MLRTITVLLFMIVSSDAQTISDKQICTWRHNDRSVMAYLCLAGRKLLDQAPAGSVVISILDHFYGKTPTAWDMVKDEVEKLIDSKFEAHKINTLQVWQHSIASRIASCKLKVNKNIKVSCYKNLQEDLAGFEPIFRGTTLKEKSMFLKYYDIYAATFMSVSYLLRNISTPVLQTSIERDIKHKAKIFSDHMQSAVYSTQAYACRFIKVKMVESYVFWTEDRLLWPHDEDVYKYMDPSINYGDVWREFYNKTQKCRIYDTTNTYIATIVDTRDSSQYPTGEFRGSFCRDSLAKAGVVPLTFPYWRTFMKMCRDDVNVSWINEIQEQVDMLKEILKKKNIF